MNPWGIMVGDVVTSETFTGVYRVTELKSSKGQPTNGMTQDIGEEYISATCFQIFTLEGKPIKLNRPTFCDVKVLRPAFLQIAPLREKIRGLQTFLAYLESLKETNKL